MTCGNCGYFLYHVQRHRGRRNGNSSQIAPGRSYREPGHGSYCLQLCCEIRGQIPLHKHPGDEHYVVAQGTTLTLPDGTIYELKEGVATSHPRDEVHGGITNSGDRGLALTTLHILDKGEPMPVLVN